MNKLLKLTLILLLFSTCKAQTIKKEHSNCWNINAIKEIMVAEVERFEKNSQIIDSNILHKVTTKKGKEGLYSFLNPEAFTMMNVINIKSTEDIVDFTTFFSQEDFDFMKCQMKNTRIKNWRNMVNNQHYFNKSDSIRVILNKYDWANILKDKNGQYIRNLSSNYFYYSIPLLNKKANYALIYRETSSSGELMLLKKENNIWIYYANSFVWSSD